MPLSANRSMPDSPVIPVLVYPDVEAAADWLCSAFGFTMRLVIGSHRIQLHCYGGHIVVTGQGWVEAEEGNVGSRVMVRVPDAHNHSQQALQAGAVLISAVQDYPYGERQYSVLDPWGHSWTFSQSIADVNPADWGGVLVG